MNNDLISKSHFDERVREAVGMAIAELTAEFKDGVRATLELLKTEPTVDAVRVARCCECKYFQKPLSPDMWGWCKKVSMGNKATVDDWYCADGERR